MYCAVILLIFLAGCNKTSDDIVGLGQKKESLKTKTIDVDILTATPVIARTYHETSYTDIVDTWPITALSTGEHITYSRTYEGKLPCSEQFYPGIYDYNSYQYDLSFDQWRAENSSCNPTYKEYSGSWAQLYWIVGDSTVGAKKLTVTYSLTKTAHYAPTTPPNPKSPGNNAAVEPSVTFQWNASNGIPYPQYRLVIDDDPNFGSPYFDQQGISGTSKSVSGLSRNTKYYWKVRAYNYLGGVWSVTWCVNVRPQTPTVQGSVYAGSPKLTWNAVSGAQYYKIVKGPQGTTYTTTSTSFIDWYEYPVQLVGYYTTLFYSVITVNNYGIESLLSWIIFYKKTGGGYP